jgi:hypothetical protein
MGASGSKQKSPLDKCLFPCPRITRSRLIPGLLSRVRERLSTRWSRGKERGG